MTPSSSNKNFGQMLGEFAKNLFHIFLGDQKKIKWTLIVLFVVVILIKHKRIINSMYNAIDYLMAGVTTLTNKWLPTVIVVLIFGAIIVAVVKKGVSVISNALFPKPKPPAPPTKKKKG